MCGIGKQLTKKTDSVSQYMRESICDCAKVLA